MTEGISPLADRILNANPHAYESLVVSGAAPAMARQLLDGVKPGELLLDPAASPVAGHTLLAALWLWHDGLDECHRIVQKSPEQLGAVDDPHSTISKTHAFWHAIMHRREGDFSNAKYWYARCASHPVFSTLANRAGRIVNAMPADRVLLKLVANGFDPSALVDLVEAVHQKPDDSRYPAAVALQQLEWRTLFDHCSRQ